MKTAVAGAILIAGLTGCSQQVYFQKELAAAEDKFRDHIGFVLYDPALRKTLVEHNAARYFTPASNTKILTLYTSLNILGDSVPGLRYSIQGDCLVFCGTGDPSFLYREVYQNRRVLDFLAGAPQQLYFSSGNFNSTPLGPGWAWDDYPYYYSAERSPFPVYGNLARFSLGRGWKLHGFPRPAERRLVRGDSTEQTSVQRDPGSNQFVFHPGESTVQHTWIVPFHSNAEFIVELLADTLHKPVHWSLAPLQNGKTLHSLPADSLYKVMMQESDNFIAEQLLILCSGQLGDTLQPEIAIRHSLKKFLFDLPDKAVWVDGSGLSRYNLLTPRSIVRLWEKIYGLVPQERLFRILAAGGKNGTLRYSYAAEQPYIFGKTGTLSNNHALSGYLLSRKGRVLIFSFMNSNFVDSTSDIKKMMEGVLREVRDRN